MPTSTGAPGSNPTDIPYNVPVGNGSIVISDSIQTKALENLIDLLVPIYQKELSLEDINEAIKFYQTPAGKHIVGAQESIIAASQKIAVQWLSQLRELVREASKK